MRNQSSERTECFKLKAQNLKKLLKIDFRKFPRFPDIVSVYFPGICPFYSISNLLLIVNI